MCNFSDVVIGQRYYLNKLRKTDVLIKLFFISQFLLHYCWLVKLENRITQENFNSPDFFNIFSLWKPVTTQKILVKVYDIVFKTVKVIFIYIQEETDMSVSHKNRKAPLGI